MILASPHALFARKDYNKDIAGLYLWYNVDSATGINDGSIITELKDNGPRNIHLNKHTGEPVYVRHAINQFPAIRFKPGSMDGLSTSAYVTEMADNPSFTVFLVAKITDPTTGSSTPLSWGDTAAGASQGMMLEFDKGRLDLACGFGYDASTDKDFFSSFVGKPVILMCAKSDGPPDQTTQIAVNGLNAMIAGGHLNPHVQITPLCVGANSWFGYPAAGMDLAEIIIFNRKLDLKEQNRIGFELASKYGIDSFYVEPDKFSVSALKLAVEPAAAFSAAAMKGEGRYIAGTTVEIGAQQDIIVYNGYGKKKAYQFDHWSGAVGDSKAIKTTVLVNHDTTATAVYREKKEKSNVFFVANDGNDHNPGTKDRPFATLQRARDFVREFKKQNGLNEPLTVMVRGGKYYLDETLVLTADDSGTVASPIMYSAYPGERPILSGGHKIIGWQKYKDNIYKAKLPDNYKWDITKSRQLTFNGKLQRRARWPNFDAAKNPSIESAHRYNWSVIGSRLTIEGPAEPSSHIAFKYKAGSLPREWAKPQQGEVDIWPCVQWSNCFVPIGSIDRQNRIITLVHEIWRIQGGDFERYTYMPLMPENPFIIENILEELDESTEWSLDTDEKVVYFWPPEKLSEDSQVVIPKLERLIDLQGVSFVTFKGFKFTETTSGNNYHYFGLEGYGAMFPVPGWSYCGDAVRLENASYCSIEQNEFYALGGNAVYLKGYNLKNDVSGNKFSYIGANGISLIGTQKAHPLYNRIANNHFQRTGEILNYTASIFAGMSDGNLIANNTICDVPHHGINMATNGYGRNIVEYNDIRRTCLVLQDTGAINAWMDKFEWKEEEKREPLVIREAERAGHIFRYNFISDSPQAFYLDDWTSNCILYGNIMVRCINGVMIHGGKNNVIENNIIAKCEYAIAVADNLSPRISAKYMEEFSTGNRSRNNIFYLTRIAYVFGRAGKEATDTAFYEREIAESQDNLFFNRTGKYEILDIERKFDNLQQWQELGYDSRTLIADPMFIDPDKDDYSLSSDSPALKTGFKPIDIIKIGMRSKTE